MKLTTLLLLIPLSHALRIGSGPLVQKPAVSLAPKPARVASRPLLVPALSYTGLAAVAVGASKAVEMSSYAGDSLFGLPLPVAAIAAIAAPAVFMLLEFSILGGGERVAKLMGGAPADARLTDLVTDVARRAGLEPPAHVFEIPSYDLNAFAAGFGTKDATVAVTSGLRSALNTDELEAVIAHELGHIRHADMATGMHVAVAIAGLGGIYELGRLLAQSDSSNGRRSSDDDEDGGSALPIGLAMMLGGTAARFCAHLLQLSMSRGAEYDADSVAAEICGSTAMISALEKIQDKTDRNRNLEKQDGGAEAAGTPALASFRGGAFSHMGISNGESSDTYEKKGKRGLGSWWAGVRTAFSTHPTTESRIEALKKKSDAGRRKA